LLVVPSNAPARATSHLIALAKENPGALNYASPGVGTSPHIAAELFCNMAGIRMAHILYRGSAPASVNPTDRQCGGDAFRFLGYADRR
jgi:tripartite-type tricarboxylate transporter receptor subunit TctC